MSTTTPPSRHRATRLRDLLAAMSLQAIALAVVALLLLAVMAEGHPELAAAFLPVGAWAVIVTRQHTKRVELDYLARRAAATYRDRIVVQDLRMPCPRDCGQPCSGCCYRAAADELSGAAR